MRRKEQAVDYIYRHFGKNFIKGILAFKYAETIHEIHSLYKDKLTYGPHKFELTTNGRYWCGGLVLRRTLRGPRVVFDLLHMAEDA